MYTKHRHELRLAWPGYLVDPSLLSGHEYAVTLSLQIYNYTIRFYLQIADAHKEADSDYLGLFLRLLSFASVSTSHERAFIILCILEPQQQSFKIGYFRKYKKTKML
jgi:hypothetical protein